MTYRSRERTPERTESWLRMMLRHWRWPLVWLLGATLCAWAYRIGYRAGLRSPPVPAAERWEARDGERAISHDVDGRQMQFVKEFEAKDFVAALDIYNRRWDEEDPHAE